MTERTLKAIKFFEALVVMALWPLWAGHAIMAEVISKGKSFCPAGKYIQRFELRMECKVRGWDKFHRIQKRKR